MKTKDLVQETLEDFENRIKQRKCFDQQWQLNMNFYMGNQFCDVGYGGFEPFSSSAITCPRLEFQEIL